MERREFLQGALSAGTGEVLGSEPSPEDFLAYAGPSYLMEDLEDYQILDDRVAFTDQDSVLLDSENSDLESNLEELDKVLYRNPDSPVPRQPQDTVLDSGFLYRNSIPVPKIAEKVFWDEELMQDAYKEIARETKRLGFYGQLMRRSLTHREINQEEGRGVEYLARLNDAHYKFTHLLNQLEKAGDKGMFEMDPPTAAEGVYANFTGGEELDIEDVYVFDSATESDWVSDTLDQVYTFWDAPAPSDENIRRFHQFVSDSYSDPPTGMEINIFPEERVQEFSTQIGEQLKSVARILDGIHTEIPLQVHGPLELSGETFDDKYREFKDMIDYSDLKDAYGFHLAVIGQEDGKGRADTLPLGNSPELSNTGMIRIGGYEDNLRSLDTTAPVLISDQKEFYRYFPLILASHEMTHTKARLTSFEEREKLYHNPAEVEVKNSSSVVTALGTYLYRDIQDGKIDENGEKYPDILENHTENTVVDIEFLTPTPSESVVSEYRSNNKTDAESL